MGFPLTLDIAACFIHYSCLIKNMISKLTFRLLCILSILLSGCADSLYWSRLNTVEDIIQHPDKVKQIIETSQFNCNNEGLVSRLIIKEIRDGKYYFEGEEYTLLYKGQYYIGTYVSPRKGRIHDITLCSPDFNMPDYSFLFVENEGKWCLKSIVAY